MRYLSTLITALGLSSLMLMSQPINIDAETTDASLLAYDLNQTLEEITKPSWQSKAIHRPTYSCSYKGVQLNPFRQDVVPITREQGNLKKSHILTDRCVSPRQLRQFGCRNGQPISQVIDCTRGCAAGACRQLPLIKLETIRSRNKFYEDKTISTRSKSFFPLVDTAWSLHELSPKQLGKEGDLEYYLDRRKAQGFNTIKFFVAWGCTPELAAETKCPFVEPIDLMKDPDIKRDALEWFDHVLIELHKRDMYAEIMLGDALKDRINNEGFPGKFNLELVKRWKNWNHIWMYTIFGMDALRQVNPDNELAELKRAIKDIDPKRLISFHPWARCCYEEDNILLAHTYYKGDSLLVKGSNPRSECSSSCHHTQSLPLPATYEAEPAYEGPRNSPTEIRNTLLTAFRNGASALAYGHDAVWSFSNGEKASDLMEDAYMAKGVSWQKALDAKGVSVIKEISDQLSRNQSRDKASSNTRPSSNRSRSLALP